MRLFVDSLKQAVALLLLVCGTGAVLGQDGDDWPVHDVTVPLQLYEDGSVRAEIHADAARLPTEGDSEAKGITLSFYDPTGKQDALVKAERCVYNRAEKTVTSEDRVLIEKGNVRVSGKGFSWRANDEKASIHHDVRVEFVGMPLQQLVREEQALAKENNDE